MLLFILNEINIAVSLLAEKVTIFTEKEAYNMLHSVLGALCAVVNFDTLL
jgi:hypothetical protein